MSKTRPESHMMSHGYNEAEALHSVKPPIYQTSTFGFATAAEGKQFFLDAQQGKNGGYIYSRLHNPNLSIAEKRLALLDHTEDSALFASGMAAISTVFYDRLRPGDVLLYSEPCYGGTHYFIQHFLPEIDVKTVGFHPSENTEDILKRLEDKGLKNKVTHIHIETPINPTMELIDIAMIVRMAERLSSDEKVTTSIDNTFLGPVFQQPATLGIGYVIYSATKFLGGHSDLVAGAVSGTAENINKLKSRRSSLGNMLGPFDSWLITRSMETLHVRMERQQKTAKEVALFLRSHPAVKDVYYLDFLEQDSTDAVIFQKQSKGAGSMLSFNLKGGEQEAYLFLDRLKLVKLAVSLGSTESLAQHPFTMTHANVAADIKQRLGITLAMIRLSVGLEHHEDLIADLRQALPAE